MLFSGVVKMNSVESFVRVLTKAIGQNQKTVAYPARYVDYLLISSKEHAATFEEAQSELFLPTRKYEL